MLSFGWKSNVSAGREFCDCIGEYRGGSKKFGLGGGAPNAGGCDGNGPCGVDGLVILSFWKPDAKLPNVISSGFLNN